MQRGADSFFTRYCRVITSESHAHQATFPFKDHAQFPIISDILSRKLHHHVALYADFFNQATIPFLSAFADHLQQDHLPFALRNAQLIHLNIDDTLIAKSEQPGIDSDFQLLLETLNHSDKYCIFIVPALTWLSKNNRQSDNSFLQKHLKSLADHPKCRLIALTNPKDFRQHHLQDTDLQLLTLQPLSTADTLALLQQHSADFENFHQVIIPDELLAQALMLTQRYISTTDSLTHAVRLLDSAAARTSATDVTEEGQLKPVVTTTGLLSVLSSLTRIPASHLLPLKLKSQEFTQGMQQGLYGQDAVISLLNSELQQTQLTLQKQSGPGRFLLAGPAHSGKMTAALTFIQQRFQQTNMLYIAQPALSSHTTLADLHLQPYEQPHFLTLREVIQQTPHAVILFEDIEKAPPMVFEGLQDIFRTSFLHDVGGQYHDFRHSLFIFTTTIGTQKLLEIGKTISAEDTAHHADLMQLIMNERKHDELSIKPHYSPLELVREIKPLLAAQLPAAFCQQVTIMPFLPLNKAAIEKIIRMSINKLSKQLMNQHKIDLGYAPEVIRHLVKDAVDINQLLKPLFACVEQALLNQPAAKDRPLQLFLQLNETGQVLHCEWLSTASIRQHAN